METPDRTEWGLTIRTAAPDYELRDLEGEYQPLSRWRGRRVLLIFTQENCRYSRDLLPFIAGLGRPSAQQAPLPVLISIGDEDAVRSAVRDVGIGCPVLQLDDIQVPVMYGFEGSPAACLIDEAGHVAGNWRGAAGVLQALGIMPGPGWGQGTTPYRWVGAEMHELLHVRTVEGEQSTARSRTVLDHVELPLVSVILCTRDRPRMLGVALECYRRQTYPARELVVVDSGGQYPADENAITAVGGRVFRATEGLPVGRKLNMGVAEARGMLCQKWDDDDWYAASFLETLVSAYLADEERLVRPRIVYVERASWFDLARWRVLDFALDESHRGPSGGTLLFARKDWELCPFRPVRASADVLFVRDQLKAGAVAIPVRDPSLYLYVRHDRAGGERGHVWGTWIRGDQPMEQYLAQLSGLSRNPGTILPPWAFRTYGDMIDDPETNSQLPDPGGAGANPRIHGSELRTRAETRVAMANRGISSCDREAPAVLLPRLLLLTPVVPSFAGRHDARMRVGVLLQALREHHDVYLLIIPPHELSGISIPDAIEWLCKDWSIVWPGPDGTCGADHLLEMDFDVIYAFQESMCSHAEAYVKRASRGSKPEWHLDLDDVRPAGEIPRSCDRVYVRDSRRRVAGHHESALAHVVGLPDAVNWPQVLAPPPSVPFTFLFIGDFERPSEVKAIRFLLLKVLPPLRTQAAAPFLLLVAGRDMVPLQIHTLDGIHEVVVAEETLDLADLYARASAVVAPFLRGGPRRTEILEAMSYRRPIVTTSAAVEGLAVSDGQHVLVADDARAFATACRSLMSVQGLNEHLVQNGYELCLRSHSVGALSAALSTGLWSR